MISLVIEAADSAELRAKVLDLVRVLQQDSQVVVENPPGPTLAVSDAPPAETGSAPSPSEEAPTETSASPASAADKRTALRAVLAEMLSGPLAADALSALKKYATSVSRVADDDLDALAADLWSLK